MLHDGDQAPVFTLVDQHETAVRLEDFRGSRVLVYFYPKADTPGCTTQACELRDIADRIGDTVILGISPDPPARLAKFAAKHSLGFGLLSDARHDVATAYGVWVRKKLYGREYDGIQRAAFLIGADGRIERAWPKISPAQTAERLLAALDG